MNRITRDNLEAVVDRINRITNSPMTSYTKTKEGKYTVNIGNYHLNGAYGGFALYRMQSEGGGIQDILSVGHQSKRELYNLMHAYIRGLEQNESN